jgi:hypothetical protein
MPAVSKLFLAFGLGLLARLACAQDPIPVTDGEGLCQTILNSGDCAAAIEAQQIQRSHGRVRRDSAALHLRLATGGILDVVQDTVGPSGGFDYFFLGLSQRLGYYVLWAQPYEGHYIRLVNARTGWSTLVDDLPTVSPDGRRFVTLALDREVHISTTIVVWHVEGDTLRKEWDFAPNYTDPHDVRWLSNRSFEFVHSRSSPTIAVVVDTASIDSTGQWGSRLGP